MIAPLPRKLEKEPIIDALFEVRFTGKLNAVSEILPGFLYSKLSGNKSIVQLTNAQIPKSLRELDPNLRYAPISRVDWQNFIINIGERAISIGCKLPYPGWVAFKNAVEEVLKVIVNSDLVDFVERYSLKYIDLIPSRNVSEQVKLLNFDMTIAGHKLEKENFQVRIEIPRGNFINVIHFISSSTIRLLNGNTEEGVVIDVDSICVLENLPIKNLFDNFSQELESIHLENKKMFFSCLTAQTIESLGATYV